MHICCQELWDQLFTCYSTSNKTSKTCCIDKMSIPAIKNKHTVQDQDRKPSNLKTAFLQISLSHVLLY